MTLRRALGSGSVALLLVAVLTACFPILPGLGGNPGGEIAPLTGSWSGSDSDGDDWSVEFQADNTLGVTFNGVPSDVVGDTWTQNGTAVQLTVTDFVDGDITFTGEYGGGESLSLNGDYAGRQFTLTLRRE